MYGRHSLVCVVPGGRLLHCWPISCPVPLVLRGVGDPPMFAIPSPTTQSDLNTPLSRCST
jgi:hypothetical protein